MTVFIDISLTYRMYQVMVMKGEESSLFYVDLNGGLASLKFLFKALGVKQVNIGSTITERHVIDHIKEQLS